MFYFCYKISHFSEDFFIIIENIFSKLEIHELNYYIVNLEFVEVFIHITINFTKLKIDDMCIPHIIIIA